MMDNNLKHSTDLQTRKVSINLPQHDQRRTSNAKLNHNKDNNQQQVASKFSEKLHWMDGTKIFFSEDVIKSQVVRISISQELIVDILRSDPNFYFGKAFSNTWKHLILYRDQKTLQICIHTLFNENQPLQQQQKILNILLGIV